LFRGRGEHPKQGCIKGRIQPEDLILNMSKDAPKPPCPVPGHKWGDIKHDPKVTWLAMYKDTIMGETKYVFLAATSSFKGQSDFKKFEKARELGNHIDKIRKDYKKQLTNDDVFITQRSTALYLIDKLALRVGGAKDDDEADTVGCCSLRTEHLEMITAEEEEDGKTVTKYKVHFDFLGKDSIRYDQTHEIEHQPWLNLQRFKKTADKKVRKDSSNKDAANLFSDLDPTQLNVYLKTLMPGLSAKVFRTYNASKTLDELLQEDPGTTIQERMVYYNRCNRDVAVLCNHQKAKSKTFDASMEKVDEKIKEAEDKYKDAKRSYKAAAEKKDKSQMEKYKRQVHTLKERLEDKKAAKQSKEDLATVSLGTSKINYLDPRISVAWCKTYDVPLPKVFNKSLIAKFPWAMDVRATWRFMHNVCPKDAACEAATSLKANDGDSSDDDDVPLAKKAAVKKKPKAAAKSPAKKATKRKASEDSDGDSDSDDDVPLTKRKKEVDKAKPGSDDSSSDDDDVPLSKRQKS